MKRQAEPASVEDVSEETNETIPDTRRLATSSKELPTPKRQRTIDVVTRSKTKSAKAAIICHAREPVPLADAVLQHKGPWPMTILSGRTNKGVNANKIDGFRFRKLFYHAKGTSTFYSDSLLFDFSSLREFVILDVPVNNETTTYIERPISISAEDAQQRNPDIWIEQRTFQGSGKPTFKARHLFFLERVVDGNVYIFPGCGDQFPGIGKIPDLHFTARVVSSLQASHSHLPPGLSYRAYYIIRATRTSLGNLSFPI